MEKLELDNRLLARTIKNIVHTVKWMRSSLIIVFLLKITGRLKIIKKNLAIVYPDKSESKKFELLTAIIEHLNLFIIETLKSIFTRSRPQVTVKGKHHIDNALAKQKGVIVLAAHTGSWELSFPVGFKEFSQHTSLYFIRRQINPTWFQKLIFTNFKRAGLNIIEHDKAARKVLKALEKNSVVFFYCDQYAGNKGRSTPFFGKQTLLYTSIAKISGRNDVPIIPFLSKRINKYTHLLEFQPEVDFSIRCGNDISIDKRMLVIYKQLEDLIMRCPEQWYCWLHDLWKVK